MVQTLYSTIYEKGALTQLFAISMSAAGPSATATYKGLTCPVKGTVVSLVGCSEVATTDTSSNYYTIQLNDGAGNAMLSTAYSTYGDASFVADIAMDITGVDQNRTVVAGEQLQVVMTKFASGTDISGGDLSFVVLIKPD